MNDMRLGKTARLLTLLLFCLACLCLAGGRTGVVDASEPVGASTAEATKHPEPSMSVELEKQKRQPYEEALRDYMKSKGKYLGKAGHCYYTYTNHGREIKIIGFRETVRKLTIPDKIKGKKVTEIDVESWSFIKGSSGNLEEVYIDWNKYASKTRCIVIPRYVKKLGRHIVFLSWGGQLQKIEEYQVSSKNKHFMAKNGVLFDKKGKTLLCYPDKKKGKFYQIPKGVLEIGEDAFRFASVKKVSMPDSVRLIGKYAFSHSKLKRIRLSKGLISIGGCAFYETNIEKLHFQKD